MPEIWYVTEVPFTNQGVFLMTAVYPTNEEALLKELLQDGDYHSLCDAFEENYRIIMGRRPDIAKDLKDRFWNDRYQCWDIQEADLWVVWDLDRITRPTHKRKKSILSVLRYRMSLHQAILLAFMSFVLGFVSSNKVHTLIFPR
jgi:hypothetical protein